MVVNSRYQPITEIAMSDFGSQCAAWMSRELTFRYAIRCGAADLTFARDRGIEFRK
jgi:hypothetical protein